MQRYKLIIEYDGTPFAGWQIQKDASSVQGSIVNAVRAFCGQDVTVFGAGRTDAGVHATGQVAHVDLEGGWPAEKVRDALNFHLKPHPISVLASQAVSTAFDARFSASKRHYEFVILNRKVRPALDLHRVWHVPHALGVAGIRSAAQCLIGRHDFTTFRSAHCQAKSPIRTMDRIDVVERGERILLRLTAQSFLHNQVRSIVGSLVEVGRGRWPVEAMGAALEAKDRTRCGPVAPPQGLTLVAVDYSDCAGG